MERRTAVQGDTNASRYSIKAIAVSGSEKRAGGLGAVDELPEPLHRRLGLVGVAVVDPQLPFGTVLELIQNSG
jgi:hypothetical protein